MKKMLFLVFILFAFENPIFANNWHSNFEDVQREALTTNKLILVDFWANWCGPCKRMDTETWSADEVKLLMSNYVPVKVDIDIYKQLATNYSVSSIPYIFIMDGNGKVLYSQKSYKTKSQVISLLKKYAISTEYLNQHLINYYANPDFSSAFRLASKYSDFSIIVNKEIRHDILQVSNVYFDISEKLLKKTELKNKALFLQKMELFKVQEIILRNNLERASKLLGNMKEENLEAANIDFSNFLNYIVSKEKNDETSAAVWIGKLSENDKQKAALFLKST